MVLTGCEVILVNRNALDSFRVGPDGCKLDTSVCTSRRATCHSDGSCLCSDDEPNFRNPRTRAGDGKDYGCVDSDSIRAELVSAYANYTLTVVYFNFTAEHLNLFHNLLFFIPLKVRI